VTLFDSGPWAEIQKTAEARQWPRWELKVSHGARRLFLANSLLEMGDDAAACEELIYSLGHVVRGLLLRSGVFPLSRPEIAEQVRKLGYPHLADIHEELRRGEAGPGRFRQARAYAKKLLCHLDPVAYEACALESRQRARAKQNRPRSERG
jgi:hypothetical protein